MSAGAPTYCWKCQGQLQRKPDGGYYKEVRMIDNHERTLHVGCARRHDGQPETPHIFPDNPHDEYVKGEGNH